MYCIDDRNMNSYKSTCAHTVLTQLTHMHTPSLVYNQSAKKCKYMPLSSVQPHGKEKNGIIQRTLINNLILVLHLQL